MFVKIYQYHIKKEKEVEYLSIQEKAGEIYKEYLDFHTIYLKSKDSDTKWLEITFYRDEDDYKKSIEIINKQLEIQELFKSFQSVLVSEKNEITEEDFLKIKEKYAFK
ncbi:hypothetical protein KHA93_18990 [Bacillus sp. FJAT-49732]|uniref:ABM domain-containing protein n=1 Tax=Lederbergia citrisecunda TaxID=2833583 RepID=A0A942YLP8_9BACI|nr:hypothetical protein [Lederbergia citrisecunda]MBS4201693.1 hypothetical protein [Lederbergia citrisecunda]